MSEKLKPNPFCGHAVHREMVEDDQHRDIVCDVECASEYAFRMSDEEWNSRPREEKAREALEAAKEQLPSLDAKPASSEPAVFRARRLVEEALAMLGKEEK